VIDNNGLPSTAAVVNHPVDLVEQDILDLHKLSLCMRKRRYENGALSMNSIKLSFKLDDNGDVEKVWVYQLKESNRLIEEFMLRANMSVAEKLCEHYPGEAMLRRHEPPIERRLVSHINGIQG
jgi:protein SSD1